VSIPGGPPVVLASSSAIRAELLMRAGVAVIRDAAGVDESEVKRSFQREGLDAARCAEALAAAKATRVAQRHPDALVIGADQILDLDGTWFDKPRDLADARRQLEALRGKRHELATAVVVARNGAVLWRHVERPRLAMRDFSDRFIEDYLAALGDDVLTVVGAYRLEGEGVQLFARIEGDYFAILGLPLLPLLDFLRGHRVVLS
jgi:nucleoside triphosphate pyrophosphatase